VTEVATTPPAAQRHARMYQPLVPAAIAFTIGILAGDWLGGSMAVWCGAALAAGAVWLALYLRKAREGALLAALLVALAAAGAARYRASVDPPPHDLARLAANGPRLVTLEGTMVRSAQQASLPADVFLPSAQKPASGSPAAAPQTPFCVHSNFLLDARRVCVDGKWLPADGRVRVAVREALPPAGAGVAEIGDAVRVVGMLGAFGEPTNPGGFDMAAYLRRQGIRTSLSTGHWAAVRVTEPAADRMLWMIGVMRRWTLARLDVLPSLEGQAVAAAMLFGRRDLLDFDSGQMHGQDIERAFVATGTVHFMAVSGFNVALVVAPVLFLLRLLGAGRKLTSVIVAAVALAFVLVTELEPPVLRAAILAWVVCLGWMMGRPAINLNTFAISALLVLLVRPGDLFTTSFQLSFLAVLGMIFLVSKVQGLVGRFTADGLYDPEAGRSFWSGTVLRGTFLIGIAATMITLPVIAYRFHLVGWLAPIATVVLVGLVFALTVGGMALVALGWIAPWLSEVLAALTDGLGRTIAAVVLAMAKAPGAYFYLPEFSPAWLLVAYGLMAVWVWRERLGVTRRRLATAVLVAAAAFVWSTGHRAPDGVRATFLAVGGGNTTLLELPDGRNILYDTGSTLSFPRAAEMAVAPALWSRGITRVDAIFLSHAHFDHFKDILPLVERFGIRRVFVPPTFMRIRLRSDDAVIEALLARGVRVELFGAGDRLAGTGATEVCGLWPRGGRSMGKAINSGSLVLAVSDGRRRLLLTGDLGPPAIDAFLEAEPRPRADAMLWPHHGHDPEAVERLATAAGAKVLVISSGRTVRPVPPPAWLKERGAACYHTGNDGAVTVDLRPEGLRVATFCRGAVEPEEPPEEDAVTEDD
jgi:competence protein ComEC